MPRMFSITMQISFLMKDGETQDQALDRVLQAMDGIEHYVASWQDEDIEVGELSEEDA